MILKKHSLYFASALFVTLCFGLLTSCSEGSPQNLTPIEKAVANSDRSDNDVKRDEFRKPIEVLTFFGVEPGMTVIDIFSAGGYYSEILNYVVGPEGRVIAHNNAGYLGYAKEEMITRYADGRLTNITPYTAEANELELKPFQADRIFLILGFHDIFYKPEDNSWNTIDPDLFLQSLYDGLKPGGILGIVDHRAPMGASSNVGNSTHRIDPQLVIEMMTAKGFILDGDSDVLRNPEDDLTQHMWDESIRGKTDRFVLKFKRPNE